jgi:hypothetical protein
MRPPAAGWGDWRNWLDNNGWGKIALVGEAYRGEPYSVSIGFEA